MYQQILKIGEGQVPAVIEYTVEDGYYIVQRVSVRKRGDAIGQFDQDITGVFDDDAICGFGERLDIGHEAVIRELDSLYQEDRAADRAAFKEAYA